MALDPAHDESIGTPKRPSDSDEPQRIDKRRRVLQLPELAESHSTSQVSLFNSVTCICICAYEKKPELASVAC